MTQQHVVTLLATLALFTLVESAGVPLPGGTAMLAAGVLAGAGEVNVAAVCAVAIAASLIGGNLGYAAGFHGGTWLLTAPGWLATHRRRVYDKGAPLMQRFGWAAVGVGRFFTVLRECVPVLAGSLRMRWWPHYLLWNAAGGVAWVLWHVLLGYFVGEAAGVSRGLTAIVVFKIALALLVGAALLVRRRRAVGENAP